MAFGGGLAQLLEHRAVVARGLRFEGELVALLGLQVDVRVEGLGRGDGGDEAQRA
ncbi:hypothetical protein D9M72_318750 [compost metagenome]